MLRGGGNRVAPSPCAERGCAHARVSCATAGCWGLRTPPSHAGTVPRTAPRPSPPRGSASSAHKAQKRPRSPSALHSERGMRVGLFFLRCCRFPLIRTAVTFWPSRTSPAASLCPAVRFWWGGGDVHAMPFAPFPQQHPAAMGAFGWLSAQPPPPEQSQEMEMGIK